MEHKKKLQQLLNGSRLRENPILLHSNSKGADQSAHAHSLISAFVIHSLESFISNLAICETLTVLLVSVGEQTGLSLIRSQTPKSGFLAKRPKLKGHKIFTWQTELIIVLWFSDVFMKTSNSQIHEYLSY